MSAKAGTAAYTEYGVVIVECSNDGSTVTTVRAGDSEGIIEGGEYRHGSDTNGFGAGGVHNGSQRMGHIIGTGQIVAPMLGIGFVLAVKGYVITGYGMVLFAFCIQKLTQCTAIADAFDLTVEFHVRIVLAKHILGV